MIRERELCVRMSVWPTVAPPGRRRQAGVLAPAGMPARNPAMPGERAECAGIALFVTVLVAVIIRVVTFHMADELEESSEWIWATLTRVVPFLASE